MKKIIQITLMALSITNAYALTDEELYAEQMKYSEEHIAKSGYAVPDGGIKIVPANKLSHYAQIKDERLKNANSIKRSGYINEPSDAAKQLLSIEQLADKDYKENKISYNPQLTNLRHNINELRMAYTFLGVPPNDIQNLIGIAPYLNYIDNKGWMGAVQFFKNDELGACAFYENNVKLGHGSIIIAKEDRKDDVNGKDTLIYIEGTKSTGFSYTVEWFDLTFFRKLQCASTEYSINIMPKLIELAKRTDKYQG